MNPFILIFSILIISVSIFLIKFKRDTVLSKNNDSKFISKEDSIVNLEYNKDDAFEEILNNNIDYINVPNETILRSDLVDTITNKERLVEEDEVREFKISNDNIYDNDKLANKINELKMVGLSNQEIAKQLGKGIREIETIIKINTIRKVSKI